MIGRSIEVKTLQDNALEILEEKQEFLKKEIKKKIVEQKINEKDLSKK